MRRVSPLRWLSFFTLTTALGLGCDADGMRNAVVKVYPSSYKAEASPSGFTPEFKDNDLSRPRLDITLTKVAEGFAAPTDIQFVPGLDDVMWVAEKGGGLHWFRLSDRKRGTVLTLKPLTDSEQGLLGVAFHPRFADNGKFYVNYITEAGGKDITRVSEWQLPPAGTLEPEQRFLAVTGSERVVLEVVQPYANHNGGQVAFGPDGFLYVGLGDGGWANDPNKYGQNRQTLLGKMLRLNVDSPEPGKGYSIPADNPFVGSTDTRPEIFAVGLRNPWRYSFTPDGRLITGDVGQDAFEEVTFIPKGSNLGWNVREGMHCFPKDTPCDAKGLLDPIFEYGHDEGQSITGGYVYTGTTIPALSGKYVFGDFVSGRLWALELPAGDDVRIPSEKAYSLGRWPVLISTFGRDGKGNVYLSDFGAGVIYRMDGKG